MKRIVDSSGKECALNSFSSSYPHTQQLCSEIWAPFLLFLQQHLPPVFVLSSSFHDTKEKCLFFPSPQCCPSADDTWIMLDNVIEQIISKASLALCNMIYTAWSCTEIINWKLVAVNWSSSKGPYDAPLLCWTIPCQTNVNLWNGAFTPGWSLNASQCIYKVLFLFKALEKKNLHIPASSKYYM